MTFPPPTDGAAATPARSGRRLRAPGGRRLRAPGHRVDRRAVAWWSVRSGLVTVGVLVAELAVLAGVVTLDRAVTPSIVLLVVTVVVGAAHLLVVPRWRWSTHRWEVTDEAVHTLAGWVRLEWRIGPIARIQTVDTEQGPLQRLFGLATVTVTTASAHGALRIDGLDTDRAAALAQELTRATEAVGWDAT